jgi:hypothetical protein
VIELDLGHPNPDHNWQSPASEANARRVKALLDSGTLPTCPHCTVRRHLVTMPGDGVGLSENHEDHCPTLDTPGVEVDLTDLHDDPTAPLTVCAVCNTYEAACHARRLFAGRPCCSACNHTPTPTPTEPDAA